MTAVASITCVGCGVDIDVDPEHPNWSVRTEVIDGTEYVVERHLSLVCPSCGLSETVYPVVAYNLVVEAVDPPEPFVVNA